MVQRCQISKFFSKRHLFLARYCKCSPHFWPIFGRMCALQGGIDIWWGFYCFGGLWWGLGGGARCRKIWQTFNSSPTETGRGRTPTRHRIDRVSGQPFSRGGGGEGHLLKRQHGGEGELQQGAVLQLAVEVRGGGGGGGRGGGGAGRPVLRGLRGRRCARRRGRAGGWPS